MSTVVEIAGLSVVGLPIIGATIIITVAAYALIARGRAAQNRIPFRERAMWGL